MGTIQLGMVDDHPIVREGLRAFLGEFPDIDIAWDVESGREALERQDVSPCQVLLLDWVLPGALDGGWDVFRAIRGQYPAVRILILTSLPPQISHIERLAAAGAWGYLHKSVSPGDLLTAIRQIAKGRKLWDSVLRIAPDAPPSMPYEKLTARETAVLRKIAQGLSNKEIAQAMDISIKTVKVHVSHILAKLQVYDRTQAVIYAHQMGLVRLDRAENNPHM